MKARESQIVNRRRRTQSVFEWGSPLPLLERARHATAIESARGLAHSKTWRAAWVAFLLILLHAGLCLRASGQYSIGWSRLAGGGGTSSSGQYSVTGTVGQHDAGGPMTGGNYSLTGGFWSLMSAVQTPGAPTLYISHSAGTVTVYWQDVSGWSLQQNGSLTTPANWTAGSGITTANGTNYLSLVSPAGSLFFRLSHP